MKRMSKKGQEMSISTLVIVVIAIIVLVLVVLGFSMGWQNLWNRINIFAPTGGLADVVSSCKIAVSTGSTVDFCQQFRKLKLDSGEIAYYSCDAPAVKTALSNEGIVPLSCLAPTEPYEKTFCKTLKLTGEQKARINKYIYNSTCDIVS
ncbi:MAG: hypothetical protein QXD13_02120 [Candidatus Pacearchaeota archaeon]